MFPKIYELHLGFYQSRVNDVLQSMDVGMIKKSEICLLAHCLHTITGATWRAPFMISPLTDTICTNHNKREEDAFEHKHCQMLWKSFFSAKGKLVKRLA